MSDLLGSILDNMTKPPNTTNKADIARRARYRKEQERARRKRKELQAQLEKRVDEFVKGAEGEFSFDPAERDIRALQHEIAETAGLVTVSCFNGPGVEKHVTVFKKEHCPSDEGLKKRRFGESYVENYGRRKEERSPSAAAAPPPAAAHSQCGSSSSSTPKKRAAAVVVEPASDYRDKYKNILNTSEIGRDNRDYHGLVPVHMLEERSIEDSLNEIREKKRRRANPADP